MLITVGDNDFVDQAEEWFTALNRAGKRARLVVYRGEGHLLLSPANIEHFWGEVLAWFDTYLQAPTGQASVSIPTGTL
jgi:dipeptidyl aminopeptidase/acylaminoacyl peptidase